MGIVKKYLGSILNLKKKPKKKPSLLKEVMNNPDKFKLEASVQNEEIIVRIKRNEGS